MEGHQPGDDDIEDDPEVEGTDSGKTYAQHCAKFLTIVRGGWVILISQRGNSFFY